MDGKDIPTKRIEVRVIYEIDQDDFGGEELESVEVANHFAEWIPLYDLEVEILSISDSTRLYDPQCD